MKIIRYLILILVFCSNYIYSQQSEVSNKIRFGFFYSIGFESISGEDLNDFLFKNSYYKISNSLFQNPNYSIGLIIRGINDPLMTQILFNRKIYNYYTENNSFINSYGVNLIIFYNLSKNQKWTFAPLIGIGINNYNLTAVSKNVISSLSDNLLQESFEKNSAFSMKLGVNIEREILINKYTFNIGLETYYNFDLGDKNWYNSSNSVLKNIPSIGMSGFGVLYNVGFILK